MGEKPPERPSNVIPLPKKETRPPRPLIEVEAHPFSVEEVRDNLATLTGIESAKLIPRAEKRNAQDTLIGVEFTIEGGPDHLYNFTAKGTHAKGHESPVTAIDWSTSDYMTCETIAEYINGSWVKLKK